MTWSALWQWNTWCHSPQWKLFLTIGCKFPINTRWRRDFARSCQWMAVSAQSARPCPWWRWRWCRLALAKAGWLAGQGCPARSWFHRGHTRHAAPTTHQPSRVRDTRVTCHVACGLWINLVIFKTIYDGIGRVSHPHTKYVARSIWSHPSIFHNLSFIRILPCASSGSQTRSCVAEIISSNLHILIFQTKRNYIFDLSIAGWSTVIAEL